MNIFNHQLCSDLSSTYVRQYDRIHSIRMPDVRLGVKCIGTGRLRIKMDISLPNFFLCDTRILLQELVDLWHSHFFMFWDITKWGWMRMVGKYLITQILSLNLAKAISSNVSVSNDDISPNRYWGYLLF